MRILVTGAAGYLGHKIVNKLADEGHQVHALVRSDAAYNMLRHPNISIFKGDILSKAALKTAMQGCSQVYHTAAKVGAWASNPSLFYNVNVEGTRNVLETALQSGLIKAVYTSSCGVIGPTDNELLDETHIRTLGFTIDYDRSKKEGEEVALLYAAKGMQTVIVNPSKVYGPGHTSHALTATAIIEKFLKKGITFIPAPGTYRICLAFVDDVVNGHLLAMEKGQPGNRYILGGPNISYLEFFKTFRQLARSKAKIILLPKKAVKSMAHLQKWYHQLTGAPVRFMPEAVDHLFSNYVFSSERAIRELGYTITPLEEAITKTIQFINASHHES